MPIATVKPAALLQKRGASAKRAQADSRKGLMSSSSQEPSAPGKPAALFSFGREEPGNQFKSSVFKYADPSNLGRSLPKSNKDHLLCQAKSELVRQEHQVGITRWTRRIHWISTRTSSSTRRIIYEGKVLRDTQIRSMHEMGEMKRAQELRVDEVCAKIDRKSWDNTKAHFPVAANARADEFHQWFGRISKSGIKSQWEIVLRFQSACNDSKVLVSCWAATNACLLIHGIHRDYRKTILVINSLRLIHTRDHPEGIHPCAPQRARGSVQQATGSGTPFARDDKQSKDTIPMPTFARRPSTVSSFIPVELQQNFMVGQQIRQIHYSTIILGVKNSIQKSSDYLFWFPIGCHVMDQRCWDGWFSGWIAILAIGLWKEFQIFRAIKAYYSHKRRESDDRKTVPGKPDAKSFGINRKVRFTQSTQLQASIREKKGPSLGQIQVKPQHQRSPYAIKIWGQVPWRDWKTRAMCPKQGLESCQKHLEAQRERQNYILLACGTVGLLVASAQEPEEREFVVDSGASMQMVSKKDFNSGDHEDIEESHDSDDGPRRGANKWRSDCICQTIGLVCQSFLKKLSQFFPCGSSVRIMGKHTTGPAVKKHISSEMARELIAINPTMYHLCFSVYQRVLPQLHLHLPLHHLPGFCIWC